MSTIRRHGLTPAQQKIVAEVQERATAAGADIAAIYSDAIDRAVQKVAASNRLAAVVDAELMNGGTAVKLATRPVGILTTREGSR